MSHHSHSQTTTTTKVTPSPCPPPEPQPVDTCCDLICFERPNYFCGHLLTDADLTLDQRYFREKNKLYNRALHGHGIVCGLRLTCDHDCPGGILIDKGYAIDDCGNDLVVCEPMRFPVLDVLINKGYLIEEPQVDPCTTEEKPPECEVPQCFYVTICYQEEQTDFTTPFVAGCRPKLSECEPQRTRETVVFDAIDALPEQEDCIEAITCRLEKCFKLFSKGQFAQALKDNQETLVEIIEGNANAGKHSDYQKLFCLLHGLLLLYLKRHPDNYNCTIEDGIPDTLVCDPEKDGDKYPGKVKDAFCLLLQFAWQHVVSCALGELVPPCSEPGHASCIVLGTVTVEGGNIVRVCNCPRSYVWSFANLCEVFFAALLGELACTPCTGEDKDAYANKPQGKCEEPENKGPCCREFDFDCECLLGLLRLDSKAPFFAGTEALSTIKRFKKILCRAFDFTDPCKFSPRSFYNLDKDQVSQYLPQGVPTIEKDASLEAPLPNFLEYVAAAGLGTGREPVVLELNEKRNVTRAFIDRSGLLPTIDKLQKDVIALQSDLAAVQAQFKAAQSEQNKGAPKKGGGKGKGGNP